MKRSDFCKTLISPGIACSCAMGMGLGFTPGSFLPKKNNLKNPFGTPCEKKMEFTQAWIKRFFDIVDRHLDENTRVRLMQANGAECAKGAYGELTSDKPATIEEIDRKINEWQKKIGKENVFRENNTVYFNYVGNNEGLKISDGYCLCPMIEDKPEILSSTYCQCSVGYVKYMFQRFITFKPVEVELLESLRSGGKACRFKVTLI
ncbi:MAG: hypothetical protein HPY62_11770 [Bacteroidales bacterium]|nr:hypothetical protein [Bacteroidales bacterium]